MKPSSAKLHSAYVSSDNGRPLKVMMSRPSSGTRWAACTEAGCLYAASVFAIGFGLGAIRVPFLVPRIGATFAVLLEAPLMLAVSWIVSKRVAKKFDLNEDAYASLLMGAIAFVVLMLAEFGVSVFAFHKAATALFTGYGSVPGAIGLAAQVCFGAFPFVQARQR